MTLPRPIAPSQTDAKSPVDDNLMDSIRINLEYLDNQTTTSKSTTAIFNVNGNLSNIHNGIAKRIDTQLLHDAHIFTKVRLAQEKSGTGGKTVIDIRYHQKPKTPIKSIRHKFKGDTQSIGRETLALGTQSITPISAPLNTQSITRAKPTGTIESIQVLGGNLVRINFSNQIDSDWKKDFYIEITGATDPANNGIFKIEESMPVNYPAVIINNSAGVNQLTANGSANLQLFSYNFINPVPDNAFITTLHTSFTGHVESDNNVNTPVYAINKGGNNLWIANQNGKEQGIVQGQANCVLFSYGLTAPCPDYYRPDDLVELVGHANSANDLTNALVIYTNLDGNNIVIYNPSGVVQASPAGEVRAYLFKYAFLSNPSTGLDIDDIVICANHTSFFSNNGVFPIRILNHSTSNNIVVYNSWGTAQAAAAGEVYSYKKVISFTSDQSMIYEAIESGIEIQDCLIDSLNAQEHLPILSVLEVNFGGGANYNIVVGSIDIFSDQLTPAGFIAYESKSIFDHQGDYERLPSLEPEFVGENAVYGLLAKEFEGDIFKNITIPENSYIGLFILEVMQGSSQNISVHLS